MGQAEEVDGEGMEGKGGKGGVGLERQDGH